MSYPHIHSPYYDYGLYIYISLLVEETLQKRMLAQ